MSSANIEMFTELVRIGDMVEEDSEGKAFINGSKLRTIHQHLQKGVRGVHFSPSPCVVSVEEKITGPSSEIVFEIHPLCDGDRLHKIEMFFEDLITELNTRYNLLRVDFDLFEELRLILDSVLKAVVSEEMKRLVKYHDLQLSEGEIKEMKNQLVQPYQELIARRRCFMEKCNEFQRFMQALDFFSRNRKDVMLEDICQNDYRTIFDEVALMNINSINIFKDSEVYGELSAMEETVDAMVVVSTIKSIDNLFGMSVLILNKAARERIEIIKNSSRDKNKTNYISFDNVSCFSCTFWPQVASEWRLRNRKWPSNEHVEMIVDGGCFVVPKQSVAGDDQHKLEWRWSFSQAEMKIAALRSPKMHYCYFVFKCFFYTYLKLKDNTRQLLPSYIVKTCMLHLCEQKEETWWNSQNTSKCVYHLMLALRKCLETKTLWHYFIKELNLLANTDDEVLESSLDIVNMLLKNPVKYFTFDSGPVGTIDGIKEEIQQLNSSSNVLSFSSGKEAFKNMVEMCKEKVEVAADYTRTKYLIPVYMLLNKKDAEDQVIKVQEDTIRISPDRDNSHVENFLYNINKPAMKKLVEDLQKARENATKVLGGIRDLRKGWCITCDGRCQQLIPCGVERMKCDDSTCDYNICMRCYGDGNSLADVVGEHNHSLVPTSQCSPYCYSQITEERLGTTNFSNAVCSSIQQLPKLRAKLESLAAKIGVTNDYFAMAGDHGNVMREKLTTLYECLGLPPYSKGNHNPDNLSPDEPFLSLQPSLIFSDNNHSITRSPDTRTFAHI